MEGAPVLAAGLLVLLLVARPWRVLTARALEREDAAPWAAERV